MKEKIKELSKKFMSGDKLQTFLDLKIKDQLIGLSVLAHIAKDFEIRDICLNTVKSL